MNILSRCLPRDLYKNPNNQRKPSGFLGKFIELPNGVLVGLDDAGNFWHAYNFETNGRTEPNWNDIDHIWGENDMEVIFTEQVALIQEHIDPEWKPDPTTYICPMDQW